MEIKNRVVVITGASSGIGAATAIHFAKLGAKVVINYRENLKGAEGVLKEIISEGGEGIVVQADVTKEEDVDRLIQSVLRKFSRIDILINNAAIPNDISPYANASQSEIRDVIDTDLVAPMIVTQKVLKVMHEQGSGKVLNTSSIRGWEHGGRSVVYAAAKAGLNSFTRTLAKSVAPNIQVNAVAPGFVKTRNYDSMSKDMVDSFIDQTYLKRWVDAKEIAYTFEFLCRNDAMTGQIIYVDGGFTLK